ncbi:MULTISPECIES: mechanosensitive ion channel family protein [Pseudanabaena]|uniref:mechanosensitive ion channel family protein n=1 Tax=Pseudanabaena TaxID=1152 RepID=UPI00247A3A3D|nr:MULTISPECIES: mechanosensitive ion channel domain-containing protein [Pseudanabaena]MEA5488835.1 mechanosensitive ion channel domain-containing protein [Pseudanabaena sp. CCNP1317]WGS74927.1 mechanosensitive ion channel [Pseudanabaena galeata CCNP1313]
MGWLLIFIPIGFTQISSPNSVQKFSPNFSDAGASVVVDGIPLFDLQAVDRFTAKERSQFANNVLIEAISTSPNINIEVRNDSSTSATSISLNSEYLLTVTANDVLPDFSPLQQANRWREILETAIAKAKEERTPQYFLQRIFLILMAIAVLIGLRILFGIATRIFKLKTGIFNKIAFGLGWVAIAGLSSEWFPLFRSWRYYIISPFFEAQWLIFFGALIGSFIFSHYATDLVKFALRKLAPQSVEKIYQDVIQPSDRLLRFVVLNIAISWSLILLESLAPVAYNLIKPISNLLLTASLYWISVKLISRYLRTYGFKIGRHFSPSSDDAILVFETIINILIFIIALVAFAKSLNFDLIGLVASLGLVGLAVAFAAQKILEQLIATLVLYLDRPFVVGDYIRLPAGELGKVESIGLRSTKIRSLGTGTIIIMPNSILVSVELENVTLAKKIMVLLYMNFAAVLGERELALVQQVIVDKTSALSGIDANSTNISDADGTGKRLRVSFAILGSQDNAIEVRKRLLELASIEIARSLSEQGIVFTMEDPTIYIQSPITI